MDPRLTLPPAACFPRTQGTKINSKGKEVPHGTRLYSIASTRYGDNFDGLTVSDSCCRCFV
jgi:hypothetical protein